MPALVAVPTESDVQALIALGSLRSRTGRSAAQQSVELNECRGNPSDGERRDSDPEKVLPPSHSLSP